MKKEIIQVVFLALIIIMPLVFTSIIKLNDSMVVCELAEAPSEEEQKGGQEPEAEDAFDEFLIHNQFSLIAMDAKNLRFLEKQTIINSTVREILTPPPKLS